VPVAAPVATTAQQRRVMPWLVGLAGLLVAGAAAGLATWLWLAPTRTLEPPAKPEPPVIASPAPPAPTPAPVPPPAVVRPPVPAPVPAPPPPARAELDLPRLASEAEIRDHRATAPTLFRLVENPHVFIVDFPGLESQGATFNRAAALIEKAGQPRDRVLDDAALAAAIARSGDTAATYYYGHNYRGRDLERFFALADRDGIALNDQERWLRRELARIRSSLPPGEDYAVVSVPGVEPRVDAKMRQAILHHEIGHGHFFTNPAFARHVMEVWRDVFTEQERARFRAFLEREGYDPTLEEVMVNEAMAYLLFTPDARFFSPAHVGLDDARAEELRAALRVRAPR
jgi:hypothetical protein